MSVGILALQGDVREHRSAFADIGVGTRAVKRSEDLPGLAGIVLPGGESTTLSLLLGSSGLFGPLAEAIDRGLPVFGTCAGLVLLATTVLDGRPDQRTFAAFDCTVRRNGYGRQRSSFESLLDDGALEAALHGGSGQGPAGRGGDGEAHEAVPGPGRRTLPAVFIRAPLIVEVGPEVEVLARLEAAGGLESDPVACRSKSILVTAFHPELTADRRLHRLFAQMVGAPPDRAPTAIR